MRGDGGEDGWPRSGGRAAAEPASAPEDDGTARRSRPGAPEPSTERSRVARPPRGAAGGSADAQVLEPIPEESEIRRHHDPSQCHGSRSRAPGDRDGSRSSKRPATLHGREEVIDATPDDAGALDSSGPPPASARRFERPRADRHPARAPSLPGPRGRRLGGQLPRVRVRPQRRGRASLRRARRPSPHAPRRSRTGSG